MNPRTLRFFGILGVAAIVVTMAAGSLAAQEIYRKPPKEVLDVLNAPAIPGGAVSPTRDYLLLTRSHRYPPIA